MDFPSSHHSPPAEQQALHVHFILIATFTPLNLLLQPSHPTLVLVVVPVYQGRRLLPAAPVCNVLKL
jgi:hypothetical protein